MKITLNITKAILKKSRPMKMRDCALANAMNAQGFEHSKVLGYASGVYKGQPLYAELTKKAGDFVDRFDRQKELKPTKLTLNFKPQL